jgi:hypothetical protein
MAHEKNGAHGEERAAGAARVKPSPRGKPQPVQPRGHGSDAQRDADARRINEINPTSGE